MNDQKHRTWGVGLQGRTLTIAESTPNQTTLDVSGLAVGMYQVVITNGNEILGSKKIIKD